MEQHIPDNNFSAAINLYCREFGAWTRYMGIPEYDPVLAEGLRRSGLDLHFRISFSASSAAVFIPLIYFSDTGNHVFQFPAFMHDQENDQLSDIDLMQFLKLAIAEAQVMYPEWRGLDITQWLPPVIEALGIKAASQAAIETKLSAIISLPELKPAADQVSVPDAMLSFKEYLQGIIHQPSWKSSLDEILALTGILGRNHILEEKLMLKCIYLELESFAKQGRDESARILLQQRHIALQGELFDSIGNYTRLVHNVLQEDFYSTKLLSPSTQDEVFYRYFEKEEIGISIRPFDLRRDLPMVHRWFHSEHAKTIWKMDWPLKELEHFYRSLLAEGFSHSYIGEVNGEPTFNFEVYWATRDTLGDYYEVLPSDYGTHLFIAPTDKKKKFPSLITQSIVDWLFMQPQVGRLVGEGSVDSLAALMNKVHVGFKLQHIIEMPHKKAYLNFCLREWYWEKFPENQNYLPKTSVNEHT